MNPLTWWESLCFALARWRVAVAQCKAWHPVPGGHCYCVRRRFHFGPHIDWTGWRFPAQGTGIEEPKA